MNKWDTAYGSVAVSAYLDNPDLLDKKVAEAMKRVAPGFSPNKLNPPKQPRRPNPWCNMFNTQGGCQNTQREGGCTDQAGAEWEHGCTVRVKGRPCYSCQSHQGAE